MPLKMEAVKKAVCSIHVTVHSGVKSEPISTQSTQAVNEKFEFLSIRTYTVIENVYTPSCVAHKLSNNSLLTLI